MNTVDKAQAFGTLDAFMNAQGYKIESLNDFSEIPHIASQLGKQYLTPMSSPDFNDLTEGRSICLVARKDGMPVMMGCARLEDIETEPVGKYWKRVFLRAYGANKCKEVIGDTLPKVDRMMTRRLVYFGDLFVCKGFRGSRLALRSFITLGHLASALQWDPEWTYCFIREKDIGRGTLELYGFNTNFGNAFEWLIEPPKPRDRSELLVAVSREDLQQSINRALRAIEAGGIATQPTTKS